MHIELYKPADFFNFFEIVLKRCLPYCLACFVLFWHFCKMEFRWFYQISISIQYNFVNVFLFNWSSLVTGRMFHKWYLTTLSISFWFVHCKCNCMVVNLLQMVHFHWHDSLMCLDFFGIKSLFKIKKKVLWGITKISYTFKSCKS